MEGLQSVKQTEGAGIYPSTSPVKPSAPAAPEQKKDGDKKLIGALVGLGAAAIAGVALYKTGKLDKIKNAITKNANKTTTELNNFTTKTVQALTKETASDTAKAVDNAKKLVNDTIQNNKMLQDAQNTLSEAQNKINIYNEALQGKLDKNGQLIKEFAESTVNINGKPMKASHVAGNLGNAKGDLNKANETIKKLSNAESVQHAGQKASEIINSDIRNIARNKALRSAKGRNMSEEAIEKLTSWNLGEILREEYSKYAEKAKQVGKKCLSFEEFAKKRLSA